MILLIDNYDSFSYNLYQAIGVVNEDIKVVRNDELNAAEIKALQPSHLVISPGPGFPADAGECERIILEMKETTPILGVCLGHQAICEAFGAKIVHARKMMHGKKSSIHIANGNEIFKGLPPIIEAARYHSLIAEKAGIPDELLVIAEDQNGEIMGVKHRDYEVYGVQFHPESILTAKGQAIIANFLGLGGTEQ